MQPCEFVLAAVKEDSQEGFEVKMKPIEHCESNDVCLLTSFNLCLFSV